MRQAAIVLLTALAGLATLASPARGAATSAGGHDPARARWVSLEFTASKLFMSGRAGVKAEIVPVASVSGRLLEVPSGRAVVPGPEVLVMTYTASGLGRDSLTTLYADPLTGATLQRTQLDSGSRQRQRTYRFADVGAYHYTRWPASEAEQSLPPERWTERSEGLRPYPAAAIGQPVTEATVLLWLAAAAPLEAAGDRIEVLTFSRRNVHRVTLEVTGTRRLDVDFEERSPAGYRRRRGQMQALQLRMRGAPLEAPAGDDEQFELLGLHGDLELALDPQSRAPLELRGRVKIAGQVTVRLRRAVLR
jgi:hypothetical protein